MPGFSGGTGFGTGGGYFGSGYSANPLVGANVGASGYYQAGGAYGYRPPNGSVPGNGGGGQNNGQPVADAMPMYYAPPPPKLSMPTSMALKGAQTPPTTAATAFAPTGTATLSTAASRSATPSSYSDILQQYADMESSLDGQGQAQLDDIARRYAGYEGKGIQNAISRGLAPQYAPVETFEAGRAGTPLAAMLRGLRYDQEAANRAAMEGIASQRLGIQQQRLSAAERIMSAQAQQANQAAQLQLERDRLAQQNAQFQQQLANSNRTMVQFGGTGGGSGGGGAGGSRNTIPNIGQTTTLNNGQLDRYGYYSGPNYGSPSGVAGGMYSGSGYLDLSGPGAQYYPVGVSNPIGYGDYSYPGVPGGDFADLGGYGGWEYGG